MRAGIYQGLLQTRGGGVAVLLITKEYVTKKWPLLEMVCAFCLESHGVRCLPLLLSENENSAFQEIIEKAASSRLRTLLPHLDKSGYQWVRYVPGKEEKAVHDIAQKVKEFLRISPQGDGILIPGMSVFESFRLAFVTPWNPQDSTWRSYFQTHLMMKSRQERPNVYDKVKEEQDIVRRVVELFGDREIGVELLLQTVLSCQEEHPNVLLSTLLERLRKFQEKWYGAWVKDDPPLAQPPDTVQGVCFYCAEEAVQKILRESVPPEIFTLTSGMGTAR